MKTYQLETDVTLVTNECSECHVIYAFPKFLHDQAHNSGRTFYCPNGHSQVYRTTEIDRLRHKLDQREAELEQTYQRLDGALKEVTCKKRMVTRLKNRIQNGVCPECHRHFENLERHMKTKHGS